MSWQVAESLTHEEMEKEGLSAVWLQKKWLNIAEDMALIPERNVQIVDEGGVLRIEVSEELMSCLRGF